MTELHQPGVQPAPLASLALLTEFDRGVGDLGRLVPHPLQIPHGLDDGQHQTQIAGRRLPPREDEAAFLVYADLLGVYLVIGGDDLAAEAAVGLYHRGHGVTQLPVHQAAHLKHVLLHLLQFQIELAGDVMAVAFGLGVHGGNQP